MTNSVSARPQVLVITGNMQTGAWVCRSLEELGLNPTWLSVISPDKSTPRQFSGSVTTVRQQEPVHQGITAPWNKYGAVFLSHEIGLDIVLENASQMEAFYWQFMNLILSMEVPIICISSEDEGWQGGVEAHGVRFYTPWASSPRKFKADVVPMLQELKIPVQEF